MFKEQINEARKYKRLVLAGGDGTISRALEHLVDSEIEVAFIPLGIGNDLAREFSIPLNMARKSGDEILSWLKSLSPKPMTIGGLYSADMKLQKYFSNYISFGLDALAVENFSVLRNEHFGAFHYMGRTGNRLVYGLCGIRRFFYSQKPEIISNTEESFCPGRNKTIIISNIKSYMGLGLSNCSGSVFDESFECVSISSIFDYFKILVKKGGSLVGSSYKWEIKNSNYLNVQIDGEFYPELKERKFIISPAGKLHVLC